MKNLFLTAALVFVLGANAATTANNHNITITKNQEKEYKKIDTAKVPAAILQEISTKYSGYSITEAFASEDGEYKLALAKDKTALKVYYTSAGEFVKEEK